MSILNSHIDVTIDEIYAQASLTEDFLLDDLESDSKADNLPHHHHFRKLKVMECLFRVHCAAAANT